MENGKKIPKYREIFNLLKNEILSKYREGDLFYSQRELMDKFAVSYVTIEHVLKLLKKAGFITSRPGKGFFVSKKNSNDGSKPIRLLALVHSQRMLGSGAVVANAYQNGLIKAQSEFNCEITHQTAGSHPEETYRYYQEKNFQGIIFIEDYDYLHIEYFEEKQVPYIVIHPMLQKYDSCVDINDAYGIKTAIKELVNKKCQKIMYFTRPLKTAGQHSRYKNEGYKIGLRQCGLNYDPSLVIEIKERDMMRRIEEIRKAFIKNPDIDAVFISELTHFQIIESMLSNEKQKKVKVMVFGSDQNVLQSKLPLGYVYVPYQEATLAGVGILVKRCLGESTKPEIRLLQTEFRKCKNRQ